MSKYLCLTSRSVPNQCYQPYLLTGAIPFGKSVATDGPVERKKPWWKKWGKTPMFLFNPYFLNDFGAFPQKITEGDPWAIDLEGEFQKVDWSWKWKNSLLQKKTPLWRTDTFRSKLRSKTSEATHRRCFFFCDSRFSWEKTGRPYGKDSGSKTNGMTFPQATYHKNQQKILRIRILRIKPCQRESISMQTNIYDLQIQRINLWELHHAHL